MSKIRTFLAHEKRRLILASTPAAIAVLSVVPAFAVDPVPSFDLSTTMTTAVTKMVGDLFTMIGALLPVTMGLVGLSVGVAYGIKFIKNMFSKA